MEPCFVSEISIILLFVISRRIIRPGLPILTRRPLVLLSSRRANFSGSPTDGVAPLLVNFTNLSTGDYDTCEWDFGDGATSSDCSDPVHTYENIGTYTVTLIISGDGGEDTVIKQDYIVIDKIKVLYFPIILRD